MCLSYRNFATFLLTSAFFSTALEAAPITNADGAVIQIPRTYAPGKRESKLNSNNDHGFWLYTDLRRDLGSNWTGLFRMEYRWGSNYELMWYQEYDLLFMYNVTKKFQEGLNLCPNVFKDFLFGVGCAQISRIQKNTLGRFKWVWVTRPELVMSLTLNWSGWALKQRLKGECYAYNSPHYRDYGDLRWRINLIAPWKWTSLEISPYVSNEFFFRVNTFSKSDPQGLVGGLFEDRLRVGLTSTLISNKLFFDAWWQWRPLKQPKTTHPRWFNTYQFGATTTMTF